jgi:hypothetical protein
MGKLEVLVARMASADNPRSIVPSSSYFTARSSTTVSIATSTPANDSSVKGALCTARPASDVAAFAAASALPWFRPVIVTALPARAQAAAIPGAMRPVPTITTVCTGSRSPLSTEHRQDGRCARVRYGTVALEPPRGH